MGMTEEEYIKVAVIEKMQRQDADFEEDITRVKEVYQNNLINSPY